MSFVGVTNGITTGLNIISQGKDLYDSLLTKAVVTVAKVIRL